MSEQVCGAVACTINGEDMRCDMPQGHKGGHSVTLPLHLNRPSTRDAEKAWLEAEGDCVRLEMAIRSALAIMDEDEVHELGKERLSFAERHYNGKKELHKVLTQIRVQRAGPR